MTVSVDVEEEYGYEAEQPDELTIKVGDVIHNVITAEGSWWKVELNGKKGMFPDNFVKVTSCLNFCCCCRHKASGACHDSVLLH